MPKDYEHHIPTTEAERIAIAAAKVATTDALNELLGLFGVSRGNVESVESFKRDLMFMRDLREGSEKAKSRFYLTLVALFASAAGYSMWSWIKDLFKHQ